MTPHEFMFHCYEFFLWCFRVIVVLAALAAMYFIFTTFEARGADIECRSNRDRTQSGWAWRYIEPHNTRRCWYKGTRLIPKSSLHWPKDSAVKSVTWYPRPFEQTAPINPPPLLDPFEAVDECCWPELNAFDKRFVGSK
jgi:hypothetical protein